MNNVHIPRDLEQLARDRLANNGRNPANNNAGIRTGSDLHLCEVLLKKLDACRRHRDELLVTVMHADTQLRGHGQIDPVIRTTILRAEGFKAGVTE